MAMCKICLLNDDQFTIHDRFYLLIPLFNFLSFMMVKHLGYLLSLSCLFQVP